MQLSDYLSPQQVLLLNGTTKADALGELVECLTAANIGVSQEALAKAVWEREEIMSTGIGNGLAVPHVRMKKLKSAIMAVGVSPAGLTDYHGLDNTPVHMVILIAAPQGQHETYIRLLALSAEVLKQDDLREKILAADNTTEIYNLFTGKEA